MGTAKMQREQKALESIMPYELRIVFDETDIKKTWEYLHLTFRFNIEKWEALYYQRLRESPRGLSKMEVFARFGRDHFEKAINHILYRDNLHSDTWFNLLKFIVKDKLKEKKKESRYR